jgi:glutamyl-tRNA reductase
MISRLLYFGATHKTAALAVREQFAAGPDRIIALLNQLKEVASERVVLSTCGRFELYVVQWPSQQMDAHEHLAGVLGLSTALCRHFEVLTGEAAARRALRVAAGLESRIVGEHQVLGQVRRAFELARLANATGPILSALFRSAIHTGKRVRSETAINRASSNVRGTGDWAAGRLHRSLDGMSPSSEPAPWPAPWPPASPGSLTAS